MFQFTTWFQSHIDNILINSPDDSERGLSTVINLTAAIFSIMYMIIMILRGSHQRALLAALVAGFSLTAYLLTKTRFHQVSNYVPSYLTTAIIVASLAVFQVDRQYSLLLIPMTLSLFLIGVGQSIVLMLVHLVFMGVTYQLGRVPITLQDFQDQQIVYLVICLIFFVVKIFQQARIRFISKQTQELIKADREKQMLHTQRERNQIITQLVTDISHDFRTPLSVINTNVYFIDKARDIKKLHQVQCRIIEATGKIDHVLDEMLVLMQLSQPKTATYIGQSKLTQILPLVAEKLDPKLDRIQLEYASSLPGLAIDADELHLLLSKLIENALKFSPEHAPVLVKANDVGNQVKIEVQDIGDGIAADDINHIFNPFFKIDKARNTTTNSGTGLGLAIAQTIARSNEGDIQVSSEVGQGTTFSVSLPKYSRLTPDQPAPKALNT